jgi:glycosyltransferase involved in cell wall biosynthesis
MSYKNNGFYEGCRYKNVVLPNDFNVATYKKIYPDLRNMTDRQAINHYKNHGFYEGRNYKIDIPIDFNVTTYKQIHYDLHHMTDREAIYHYKNHGFYEGREYKYTHMCEKNIIIYIICHNEELLNNAFIIYGKYWWAKPILMKYQDYSFENSFWKQLSEMEIDWENCYMIGSLSYSAFKKINLDIVDTIISNNLYIPNVYYHFMDTNIPIPNFNTEKHPYFNNIWNDVLIDLKLLDTTESNCNYWMCKPSLMKHFIDWYINICSKKLIVHPYIFEDALYTGKDYNNSVNKEKLVEMWGKPYYPHYIFIAERLNKSFFVSNHKIVFLISHEKSYTGAVNALLNVQNFYEKNNIKTIMLYFPEIISKKMNIIEYIKKTSQDYNCSPIVICNTLLCYNIVKKLSFTNIPTYWYIHEWYDDKNFIFIDNDLHLFNSNVYKILLCNKMYENYKKKIPNLNNEIIINNGYAPDFLEEKINKTPEINIDTNNNFIISIIGSIEKRKNQQRFLDDVFYKIVDNYPNVILLLVGKLLENVTINDKYKNNVIQFSVTNALPYIKMSDIIVSYSINETFPLNIIEAFYCSKPVIATDVGGVVEMIENNVNGFIIDVNDYDKCFNYITNLITDENLRKYLGENAREKFNKNYNENTTFKNFLLLLSNTYKTSYTSAITDSNLSYLCNNQGKTLTILACHTDSLIKINALLNNIQYFIEISHDIVIINSKEFESLDIEMKIKNEYESYKERQNSNDKIVNIYFKYYDNDLNLCHGKWLNYLKTIDINNNYYNNYILTNDSFIVTKSLKKFSDLKVFNTDMYGIVASNEIKYHYPDFLRGYNKIGIKKIMNYYENNKFLIRNYDDSVIINEINSTYIFESKNVLYESDFNYYDNVHFHNDKIKDYLLNRDYPIIKIKKFMSFVYEKNEAVNGDKITNNLILNEYKFLYTDLKNLNNSELEEHYVTCGKNEKRLCNLLSFINILPDFLRKYLEENNLIKIIQS